MKRSITRLSVAIVALMLTSLTVALSTSLWSPRNPASAKNRVDLAGRAASTTGRRQITGPEGLRWAVHNAGQPHSLKLENGYYRFEIRPQDHWPGDGAGTRRTRSEISGLSVPSRGRSAIAYEVMIAEADFTARDFQHVIGQRHGKADLADRRGEHPSLAFRILPGGRPSLTVAGSAQQPLRSIPRSRYAWTGTAESFPKGVWHSVMIDTYAGKRGWVDLWLDGRLMKPKESDLHTYVGNAGYVNWRRDYWKFGDYCARGTKSIVVVKIRNIRRLNPN